MKVAKLRINKEKLQDLCDRGILIGIVSLYTIGIVEIIYTTIKTLSK